MTEQSDVAGEVKPKRKLYERCVMCVGGELIDHAGRGRLCLCEEMRVLPVGTDIETLDYLVHLDQKRQECGITAAMLRDGRAAAFGVMLAALESILGEFVEGQRTTYSDVTTTIDRIRETAHAAIAKAKGEQ